MRGLLQRGLQQAWAWAREQASAEFKNYTIEFKGVSGEYGFYGCNSRTFASLLTIHTRNSPSLIFVFDTTSSSFRILPA